MSDTPISGIDTREQRQAHVRALVDEIRDIKQGMTQAKERLDKTPEDKLVQRARAQTRVNHLEDRLTAAQEQLQTVTGGARTPRGNAETRGGTGQGNSGQGGGQRQSGGGGRGGNRRA